MKSKLIFFGLVLLCLLFSSNSQAQNSPTSKFNNGGTIVTNIQRYKVDYEIENFNFTSSDDTLLINSINIDLYEESRHLTEDVYIQIELNSINYTLIMYSVEHAGLRKSQHLIPHTNQNR